MSNASDSISDAADQVERYGACVFEPADWVELRLIPNKSIKGTKTRSEWAPAAKLAGAVKRLAEANDAGFNVHVGANPRRSKGARGDAGVALARCVFVDFDHTEVEAAAQRIADAGLPVPTLTIHSGHGVHAYWRLNEPVSDLAAWTELQKDLIALLGTDKVIFNPERVMRLPGFLNIKGEPVPVAIVGGDDPLSYDLTELRALIPPRPQPKPTPTPPLVDPQASEGDRVKRCLAFLQKTPDARSGQRGHDRTFHWACTCYRFGLSDGEAMLVMEHMNSLKTGGEPWTEAELRHKLADARRKVEADDEFGIKLREERQRPARPAGRRGGQPRRNSDEVGETAGDDFDPAAGDDAGDNQDHDVAAGKPIVLTPGAHVTDVGDYIEVGTDAFANEVIRCMPRGAIYRRGVAGELTGERGAQTFRPLGNDDTRVKVDAHVRLMRWVGRRSGEDTTQTRVFVPCNRDQGGIVLAAAAKDVRLPELRVLTPYPVCRPGFELTPPGYRDGCYYDEPAGLEGLVPEPDPDVIRDTLADLVVDFPFRDEASRQNYFGLLLTPIVRPALSGNTPMHLLMAPLERTGKTKLVETVLGGVIMGREVPAMQMPPGDEEFNKSIVSQLLNGDTILHFDNIRESIDSAALASLLTARTYRGRRLGSSTMLDLPNNMTIVGTGNNVKATGEIAKRTVPINLQPATDAPEERSDFAHPDLWLYVRENRRRVLACLLGMVVAWNNAGRPRGRVPMGGFDEWAAVIGGILQHFGFTEWMQNTKSWRTAADERRGDLRALVEAWERDHAGGPLRVREILNIAIRLDLFPEVLGNKEGKALETAFGMRVLSRNVDTPVGRWVIRKNSLSRPAIYALRAAADTTEVPAPTSVTSMQIVGDGDDEADADGMFGGPEAAA